LPVKRGRRLPVEERHGRHTADLRVIADVGCEPSLEALRAWWSSQQLEAERLQPAHRAAADLVKY
jgi:hypothetical protein